MSRAVVRDVLAVALCAVLFVASLVIPGEQPTSPQASATPPVVFPTPPTTCDCPAIPPPIITVPAAPPAAQPPAPVPVVMPKPLPPPPPPPVCQGPGKSDDHGGKHVGRPCR
jgi:hypothetical protein